jgi:pimeloyl-ACP methyl ester carboxylesterase
MPIAVARTSRLRGIRQQKNSETFAVLHITGRQYCANLRLRWAIGRGRATGGKAMPAIEPFHYTAPQAELDALRQRLEQTRWPDRETVTDWSQGVPLAGIRGLCDYWRTEYDWRRCEARLNDLGQYRTEIEGVPIHFLHIRSPNPDALPLLMTHGWPGSVVEFLKVIGPLADPAAHGGDAADAFHLIIPSLPGYGFSGKPQEAGWGVQRIAGVWATLMERLGYGRYVAQGGDWGAIVTTVLGAMGPTGLAAIHLNMPMGFPDTETQSEWTPEEQAMAADLQRVFHDEMGYMTQQRTRPQTLGYALNDSPVGQAAWIYEKFKAWTDCNGEPESVLSRDEMLDNIMIYWLTGTATSSARLYWESADTGFIPIPVDVPTGVSQYPRELLRASRRWAEKSYRNIIYWNELDRGGHFAAFEQPAIFVDEVRACFRLVRG